MSLQAERISRAGLKLKPDVKARWLEALRSGEYQQGKDQLSVGEQHATEFSEARGVSYCCLGVLAKVCAMGCEMNLCTIPFGDFRQVIVDCGMGMEDTEDAQKRVQDALATLNDSDEYSFLQIAEVIEELL